LFYGTEDEDVSPEDAISACAFMKNEGGNAMLVNTGSHDHIGSLLAALPEVQQWFNASK
jgi:hypothetical protein